MGMDDNFLSIVKSVLWGRSVYDNIRKFLQFQLTVNIVALALSFIAAVFGFDPPLNAVMMLWVNLIMDTMGALALGTETPKLSLLQRKPYKRSASLVSRVMWRNILVQSLYQLLLLLAMLTRHASFGWLLDGLASNSSDTDYTHYTIIFNAFVFCQIFNEFNAREIGSEINVFKGVSGNPMFVAIIIFTTISQFLIVQYGGDFVRTTPLNARQWASTIALGFVTIPLGVVMRFIPVQEDPNSFNGYDIEKHSSGFVMNTPDLHERKKRK